MAGLTNIILGLFERTLNDKMGYFRRYYISGLEGEKTSRLGIALRAHWSIENKLHWVLDVSFGEGGNRTRRGQGAGNLSTLRRLALTMPGQVKGKKTIPHMIFRAAADPKFRSQIILQFLVGCVSPARTEPP